MSISNNPGEKVSIYSIPFQDKNYRLTRGWLDKHADIKSVNSGEWRSPTLKFLSFQKGQLILLNACQDRSFNLTLQAKDNHLLVGCNCDNKKTSICIHAYKALYVLIWHLGETYFEKLRPGGAMELAFAHKNFFDKTESTAGINVSPRPELKSVFAFESNESNINLPAILRLPGVPTNAEALYPERTLSYLLIVPFRNKLMPALLPCLGRLNKNKDAIKTWDKFLTGLQKDYHEILTDSQKELNIACYHLWKMVEKSKGGIMHGKSNHEASNTNNLITIFDAWQKIFPSLQRQQFVYTYLLYGVKELKDKPARTRAERVIILDERPLIEFVLIDKGAFYRFQMRIRVNGKILSEYDVIASFFIQCQHSLYMLASLRDAALAEWLHRSGGWITVFKEQYAQFEKEVLALLKENYSIITMARTRKK